MNPPAVPPEAWYQTKEVIAAIVGAVIASLLIALYDWLRTRRRRRSHFAALRAEMDFCCNLARTYLRDNLAAPLYRLPTIAYSNSLPALLADAALRESDTRSLLAFFSEVETLNRGLEQVEGARQIADPRARAEKVTEEYGRNRLKAQHLVPAADSSSPSYYDLARLVVDDRLRSYWKGK
jgi:hypothetical protein